jgi:tetratricopeptide (TPR) repeat protein
VELRLGALDPKPGGEAASLSNLERARGIFEELLKADPKNSRYQFGLELCWLYIGHRHRDARHSDRALAAYRQSLALCEKGIETNPRDLQSVNGVLAAREAIAALLADTGDRAGAIDAAGQALLLADKTAQWSRSQAALLRVAIAWQTMAETRRTVGDWSEARKAAVEAASHFRQFSGADSHADEAAEMDRLAEESLAHLK